MSDSRAAALEASAAYGALRKLAAEGLGAQLVLVDSDGALAHRRGGVLEAVSPACRETLFTPEGFARCDAFYAHIGAAAPEDGVTRHEGCPLGLEARSVCMPDGLQVVASGFRAEPADGSDARALGEQARGVLAHLLEICRDSEARTAPEAHNTRSLSPRMARLETAIARYGHSDAFVLIRGETGAGKHHAARALHDRRDPEAPFLRYRLGAAQPELLEATLFGHTRGAFTDAGRASEGLLGAARGGTLVLDEVGDLPDRAQALLLRLLAERRYRPLGATRERPLEARLLGTTSQDLKAQVESGALREDLFYRLDVLRLELPALRERREDLPTLLHSLAVQAGVEAPTLSAEAWRCMRRYAWPGNLHELGAEITRMAALGASAVVTPAQLSPAIAAAGGFQRGAAQGQGAGPETLADAVAALERRLIEDGLTRTGGNHSRLAAELGISRTTLIDRLHRFGLMKR